jgi:hypothetical protein
MVARDAWSVKCADIDALSQLLLSATIARPTQTRVEQIDKARACYRNIRNMSDE